MKNINLDFLAKELLEQVQFNFTGRSKEGATTKNYKIAKTFLKDKTLSKSIIDKVKNKEEENINPKDLERHLLSIHVAKKIASNKRMKQTTREEASALLKNAGIDLMSIRDDDKKVLKDAKVKFNNIYKEKNPTPVEEPTEAPEAEEPETEVPPETPETETPIEKPETETPTEKPTEKTSVAYKEIDPAKVPSLIRKLKNDTLQKLKNRIEQSTRVNIPNNVWNDLISTAEFGFSEAEGDEATKHQIGVLKRAIGQLVNRLDKHAKNARQMPSTARDQFSKAKSAAIKSQLKIVKLASPGAIEILAKRAKETFPGAIKKTKEVIGRVGEKIAKTSAGEMTKELYKKGKEFAQAKAEVGTQKLQAKMKEKEEAKKAGAPDFKERAMSSAKIAKRKIAGVASKTAGAVKKAFSKIKEKPKQLSPEERERNRKRFIKTPKKKEEGKIRKVNF